MFVFNNAGYVANYRVDIRDSTEIAAIMNQVLDEFNVTGIRLYCDNLFVSVNMLRWCRENGINLAGTTRRNFGFPAVLQFDGIGVSSHKHVGRFG